MFSGGLDSTLLAALIADVLIMDKNTFNHISIDLVNVSFAPDTSADRISGIYSYFELKQ